MESLLVCSVCSTELTNPVTLSCGYTICKTCIPVRIESTRQHGTEHPIFICPVKDCNFTSHLFCRAQEGHIDSVVKRVLDAIGKKDEPSPMKRASLPPLSPTYSNKIADLLNCPKCNSTFEDPITTHCGHVYCRPCLLKFTISGAPCMQCKSPLPQFNYFRNQAATNRVLQQLIMLQTTRTIMGTRPTTMPLSSRRSMFVTGLVILPNQHARLPIIAPAHLRMLQCAAFSSGARLLLAAIHRGRPTMARFGTIVEITAVEQSKPDSLILDVVGLDRFEATRIEHGGLQQHTEEDMSVLMAQCTLIQTQQPRNMEEHRNLEALASQIRMFLYQLARFPPPDLALGALWFETMQRIHGPLPASGAEKTMWWAAVVLPVSAAERYALLHLISLRDQLNLVLSWIKQLDSHWNHRPVQSSV